MPNRERNLRNYRPPAERPPLGRQPGEPAPAQIREMCKEIQLGWTDNEREMRRLKSRGMSMPVKKSVEVLFVATREARR